MYPLVSRLFQVSLEGVSCHKIIQRSFKTLSNTQSERLQSQHHFIYNSLLSVCIPEIDWQWQVFLSDCWRKYLKWDTAEISLSKRRELKATRKGNAFLRKYKRLSDLSLRHMPHIEKEAFEENRDARENR